jgi:mannosyltransferase OCH1-like enzyme
VIPRTIHQIWLGPDPVPEEHGPWIESWKRHHPLWEHRMWTEDNLPDDPIRREVLDRLRIPVERADILRLEVLYRYGGVYVDTDLECLRPLDGVLAGESFVGVQLKPQRVTNTFIAASAGHVVLERALQQLRPLQVYWTTSSPSGPLKQVAGPPFLQRLLSGRTDVKLLDPPTFFPSSREERKRAIAVHHMARTWHNATTLRAAMLVAERRLEDAEAKLATEQRRHEATKKRLARLEGRLAEPSPGRPGLRQVLGLPRKSG